MTANGTTRKTEEATVFVCDVDTCVQGQLLKESLAVLSLGTVCEESSYSYEWHPGQQSYLIKNARQSICKANNHIPLVVQGVQATEHQTKALGDLKPAQAVGDHKRRVET